MSDPGKRRCVIFTRSVVSPIANPDAYLVRALARVLIERGWDVRICEERGNAAFRALLREGGGEALRAFATTYPELSYHTYAPRTGAALVEFLTRVLSTADLGVVFAGVPAPVALWVGRLTRPHLATAFVESGLDASLPTSALATIEPAAYQRVLLGDPSLCDRYTHVAPGARLEGFGPLPDAAELADPTARHMLTGAATTLAGALPRRSSATPG